MEHDLRLDSRREASRDRTEVRRGGQKGLRGGARLGIFGRRRDVRLHDVVDLLDDNFALLLAARGETRLKRLGIGVSGRIVPNMLTNEGWDTKCQKSKCKRIEQKRCVKHLVHVDSAKGTNFASKMVEITLV